MKDYPYRRVLILSHNPLSDMQNNGKTLTSFFFGWPREKLAQLYLSIESPSFTICGNFFHITDYEVLHAMLSGSQAGEVIQGEPVDATPPPPPRNDTVMRAIRPLLRGIFARHYPLPEYGRDLLWRGGRWRSGALLRWLDDFAPEAVFFQGSNYPFAYDIALWICERYGAKLLVQLTDDYTYAPHPWLPMTWVFRGRYLKRFKAGLARAQRVYAIGPAMQEEYARRFGCAHISVAANCVEPRPVVPEPVQSPLRLLYAGSVHTGRWRVLREIGGCLLRLRAEGLDAVLEIHTPRPLPESLRKKLTLAPVLVVGEPLSPTQLVDALGKSNALVMVESFARSARKVTRLSLSTKIPEYMSSGRCILAVGPRDVSSMAYLRAHDAALLADQPNRETLLQTLRMLFDPGRRAACAQNGLDIAQANHRQSALQQMIYEDICAETIEPNPPSRPKAMNR